MNGHVHENGVSFRVTYLTDCVVHICSAQLFIVNPSAAQSSHYFVFLVGSLSILSAGVIQQHACILEEVCMLDAHNSTSLCKIPLITLFCLKLNNLAFFGWEVLWLK